MLEDKSGKKNGKPHQEKRVRITPLYETLQQELAPSLPTLSHANLFFGCFNVFALQTNRL